MLVQRDQFAELSRNQPLEEKRVGGPVGLKGAVRHKPVGRALGPHLLGPLTEGQHAKGRTKLLAKSKR
jgi:hypothetical protein